jgi:streptogramin lyase
VSAGSGGLVSPHGLAYGPDGNLYVGSAGTNSVLRYDGQTGAFLNVFASGGGLQSTHGITFGPDGDLYVAGWASDNVIRYDGQTGASRAFSPRTPASMARRRSPSVPMATSAAAASAPQRRTLRRHHRYL